MEYHSGEQDARLAARSERLRATGPIWWLSSSRALSFYHYHERSIYAIAPPPIGRARVTGVHTSDVSAPAATLGSATLALCQAEARGRDRWALCAQQAISTSRAIRGGARNIYLQAT